MSRHRLEPMPGYEGYDIAVGWDRRLGSFFAQMFHPGRTIGTPPPDPVDIWLGADQPVTDATAVIDAVRPYAHVPGHLVADLKADSAREGHQPTRRGTRPANTGPVAMLDQLRAALAAGEADHAVAIIQTMTATGQHRALVDTLKSLVDDQLRRLSNQQLAETHGPAGHTLYGVMITSKAERHLVIATPGHTILAVLPPQGVHPRVALAAIGFGPDHYAYRTYGWGTVELFSPDPHPDLTNTAGAPTRAPPNPGPRPFPSEGRGPGLADAQAPPPPPKTGPTQFADGRIMSYD